MSNTTLFLTCKEVAARLGVSWRTVYRLSDGGAMPRPVHIGAAVRWRVADLESWEAAGCPRVRTATATARR